MSVKINATGRRSVEAEVEVPGTPEEVWQAIATGPGISAWFVPTTIEPREGGAVTASFGPGMDSVSTITAWEPPRRFVANSRDDMGPDDPTIATEWIVEPRPNGTCVVRVVHSWVTDRDNLDKQFEGHVHGWRAFFRILRLYLTHFRGENSSAFQLMAIAPEPKSEAWTKLTNSLGLGGVKENQRFATASGVPRLAGIVERVGEEAYPEELLLRLDEPAPGLAHLFAMSMGGQVYLSSRFYFYGGNAAMAAKNEEPLWRNWMGEQFPLPEAPQ